jgi:hypothetical protein
MPRPTRTIRMVDIENPPPAGSPSKTEAALPASFADWLAQASYVITVGPETVPEVYVGWPADSPRGDQAKTQSPPPP